MTPLLKQILIGSIVESYVLIGVLQTTPNLDPLPMVELLLQLFSALQRYDSSTTSIALCLIQLYNYNYYTTTCLQELTVLQFYSAVLQFYVLHRYTLYNSTASHELMLYSSTGALLQLSALQELSFSSLALQLSSSLALQLASSASCFCSTAVL